MGGTTKVVRKTRLQVTCNHLILLSVLSLKIGHAHTLVLHKNPTLGWHKMSVHKIKNHTVAFEFGLSPKTKKYTATNFMHFSLVIRPKSASK
jgi:hypothetical protein